MADVVKPAPSAAPAAADPPKVEVNRAADRSNREVAHEFRDARHQANELRKAQHEENKRLREEQEKANIEAMERQSKYRPTPTPDEILRAQAGENVDDKEPDGSPEQNVHHVPASVSQQIEVGHKMPETKSANYSTRVSKPSDK